MAVVMGMVDQKSLESLKLEEKAKECPDCNSQDIDCQNGELFCRHCGLVIE